MSGKMPPTPELVLGQILVADNALRRFVVVDDGAELFELESLRIRRGGSLRGLRSLGRVDTPHEERSVRSWARQILPLMARRPSQTVTVRAKLYDLHVFGTRALRAAAFGVLDGLSLVQVLDRGAFERRVMEKQFAAIALDESKTLVRNQLLDCALCHGKLPCKKFDA